MAEDMMMRVRTAMRRLWVASQECPGEIYDRELDVLGRAAITAALDSTDEPLKDIVQSAMLDCGLLATDVDASVVIGRIKQFAQGETNG